MEVRFSEMRGRLALGDLPPSHPGPPLVVLSSMSHGYAITPMRDQTALKYVAEGEETYTYGGRSYPVRAGQYLIVPANLEGSVELPRSTTDSNRGLCLTLPYGTAADLSRPLLLAANCSTLGRRLEGAYGELRRSPDRRLAAQGLVGDVASSFDALIEECTRHFEGLNQLRPAVRAHIYDRLCIARAYLHDVCDRPVALAELAKHTGISKFHLLRNFRDCFGVSPSMYQRRQRLRLAAEQIRTQRITNTEAAHRFGFSDGSSLSHAYRRVYGTALRD